MGERGSYLGEEYLQNRQERAESVTSEPSGSEKEFSGAEMEVRRAELRDLVFAMMERRNMLERGPSGETVVDLDRLESGVALMIHSNMRGLEKYPEFNATRVRTLLAHAFHGVPVVSREDIRNARNGERAKPKSLFYEPDTAEAAFDPEQIRKEDFYLGLWEISLKSSYDGVVVPTEDGDGIDLRESSIAALIYHPKYGRGYRDDEGRLQVWWPSRNDFAPISVNWFTREQKHPFSPGSKRSASLSSPKEFLLEKAPTLEASGLLTTEDFQHMSTTPTGERFRNERTVGPAGSVMIGGVSYYIGKTEELRGASVVTVDPHTAAVLARDPIAHRTVISHTFSLLERDDPRLGIQTRSKTGNVTYRAPQPLVNLQPYSRDQFFRRRVGEKPEEYTARTRSLEDFDYLLKLSDRLSKEAGVNLSLVDIENQSIIASEVRAFREHPEQLIEFARRFGLDGVKALIGFSYDEQCVEKMFTIAERFNEPDAKKIFAEYSHLVDYAGSFDAKLAPEFEKRLGETFQRNIWYEKLMRRGRELLDAVHEQATEDNSLSYEELMRELAREDSRLSFSDAYESVIQRVAIELANHFGVEEIRSILNAANVRESDTILSFINPETSPEIHHDLRDLYDSIHFEEYGVNQQMDERDMEILQKHISHDGTVLDLGAGTGRHLLPLRQKGVNVHGFDYVKRHTELVKKKAPDANIAQGDWVKTPFQSGKFRTVYSLGRNILHEFQPHRQEKLFQEANRVLQMGGEFVFDIPDRERGGYRELVKGYAQKLRERGMRNFRNGTIYDSPDHENYFTRYAYSREDIERLAAAAGFEIVSVEETPLETGKDDVNLYYTFRKVSEAPSVVGEGGEEGRDSSEFLRAA